MWMSPLRRTRTCWLAWWDVVLAGYLPSKGGMVEMQPVDGRASVAADVRRTQDRASGHWLSAAQRLTVPRFGRITGQ